MHQTRKNTHSIFRKFLIHAMLLFLLFSSCKKSPDNNESSEAEGKTGFTLKDDTGNKIKFDSHPERIVSLAPNITEALFAIGADSLIAGVTDLCDYPPEAKNKKRTGSYLTPDYETIISLNPDLVIMYADNESQPVYQALKNLNLKIFVSNPVNTNDIIKMITNLGKITGKELTANETAQKLVNERQSIFQSNKGKGETCLIIVSVNPLMTAGGKTFIHEIAELSGLDNLYKDEPQEYPLVSYEDVTLRNPAYIILPCDTADAAVNEKFINELSGKLNSVSAVKENRIITVDGNVIYRPGPRFLEGVKIIRDKKSNLVKVN